MQSFPACARNPDCLEADESRHHKGQETDSCELGLLVGWLPQDSRVVLVLIAISFQARIFGLLDTSSLFWSWSTATCTGVLSIHMPRNSGPPREKKNKVQDFC